jgi:DNA-binding NarL/FixJ family response regulator
MDKRDLQCVLLADRHHQMAEGIRGLLETTFDAIVQVGDETSLLESLKRLRLAMTIVDLSLRPGGGMELIQKIRAVVPEIKLIIISVHDDLGIGRAAIEAGANGFVPTRAIATDLLSAVDAVLAGQVYVSRVRQ